MGRSVHSTFVFPHHSGVRLVSRGGLRSGGLPCLSALSLSLMTAGLLFCGAASPVLAESVYSDISDPYVVSDHVVLEGYADHSATNVTQSGHLELSEAYFCTANLEVSGQLTVGSGAIFENVYGPEGEFAGTAELHSGARLQVVVDGYAELWKVVTVDGEEESRTQVNKSTYVATPRTATVGTATANPAAAAAINAAIATGSIDQCRATAAAINAGTYNDPAQAAALAAQQAQQEAIRQQQEAIAAQQAAIEQAQQQAQ